MKKLLLPLALLVVLTIVSLTYGQETAKEQGDFVMIQFRTNNSRIEVFRGSTQQTEVIQCKAIYTQNCIIDLLQQFKSKGYKVLTTSAGDDQTAGSSKGTPLLILLGKE